MPRVKLFDEKEVLEKAMELFWKNGYYATSIRDLSEHLKLSHASLYSTFGTKDELFNKAFELYQTTNTNRILQFLAQEKDIKKGIKKLFSNAINESINDKDNKGCFVVNTTTELLPGNPTLKKKLAHNKTSFEKGFHQYLLKGEKDGQIPAGKNLQAIASLLFTLYNGLRVVGKIQQDEETLLSTVDAALLLLD